MIQKVTTGLAIFSALGTFRGFGTDVENLDGVLEDAYRMSMIEADWDEEESPSEFLVKKLKWAVKRVALVTEPFPQDVEALIAAEEL